MPLIAHIFAGVLLLLMSLLFLGLWLVDKSLREHRIAMSDFATNMQRRLQQHVATQERFFNALDRHGAKLDMSVRDIQNMRNTAAMLESEFNRTRSVLLTVSLTLAQSPAAKAAMQTVLDRQLTKESS